MNALCERHLLDLNTEAQHALAPDGLRFAPAAGEERRSEETKMITLLAKAKGTGRLVNWSRFKQGEWVDQSRISLTPTTVIPDVIVDVMGQCESIDASCSVEPLFPNGFTTAQFDISIKGKGFQVNCGRRLARGLFPLNPFAAEFGSNYDVLVAISAANREVEESIASVVSDNYVCKKHMDSEQA